MNIENPAGKDVAGNVIDLEILFNSLHKLGNVCDREGEADSIINDRSLEAPINKIFPLDIRTTYAAPCTLAITLPCYTSMISYTY